MQRIANFPPSLACNTSAIIVSLSFPLVNSDAKALREGLGFQLQLDGCKHEVMIVVNVCTCERSLSGCEPAH